MNKEILYQDKKIFYQIHGTGKPVMFVHGFGEDGTVWQNQIEFLKDKFQLIIPDLPGSGRSEMIEDMSIEGLAEVLKNILDTEVAKVLPFGVPIAIGIGGATMIGHSMGGYITLAFAEKYWNHLDAFGLLHSTAFADSDEKKATRKKGIEFIIQHGAFEFLKTTSPNLFSSVSKKQIKNLIDIFIESISNFSSTTLISYYKAMIARPDRTPVLKNSTMPVLFVAGEQDNAVPIADSLKQYYMSDICHFHILKNSGHMGMLEEPEKLNNILLDFLS